MNCSFALPINHLPLAPRECRKKTVDAWVFWTYQFTFGVSQSHCATCQMASKITNRNTSNASICFLSYLVFIAYPVHFLIKNAFCRRKLMSGSGSFHMCYSLGRATRLLGTHQTKSLELCWCIISSWRKSSNLHCQPRERERRNERWDEKDKHTHIGDSSTVTGAQRQRQEDSGRRELVEHDTVVVICLA